MPAVRITRQAAEKGGRNAEPGQRSRCVERTAAGHRPSRPVRAMDLVDQRLSADEDHADDRRSCNPGRANLRPVGARQPAGKQLTVRCECGFEARGTLSELFPVVKRHGLEAHNMKVTRSGVAAMAKPL